MNVYELSRSRAPQLSFSSRGFYEGQIVRGKILKLYPFNQASVQIGHNTLTAQLETPLVIGENYYLKVQNVDEKLHLKVISDRLQQNEKANATTLLNHLGLKVSKQNSDFVHELVKEKIPFTKNQLQKAFALLSKMKNDVQVVHTLKEIIKNELPVTNHMLQAVHATRTSELTNHFRALLQAIEKKDSPSLIERQLVSRISPFVERINQNNFNQVVLSSKENQHAIFHILKTIGVITTVQNHPSSSNNEQASTIMGQAPLKQLDELWLNQTIIRQAAEKILAHWEHRLPQFTGQSQEIPQQVFEEFKQDAIAILKTIPESTIRNSLQMMLNNNTQLKEFLQTLTALASTNTYHLTREILTSPFLATREQFLQMVRQFLTTSGMTYEYALNENLSMQETPIKSLLIQLLNSNMDTNEHATKLLHLLNGLQLKSVQETSHFTQASLTLPGEKWGLSKDVSLEFSGKKDENGQIDPSNCRILFILELKNMKETIVEMNVQKRFVNITIYNDQLTMRRIHLEKLLEKGLKKIDFHLSTINIKPYNKNKKASPSTGNYVNDYVSEGIDFRI